MARQVEAYRQRFKALTVPELREAAKKRHLNTKGKKEQLLLRLSLWVRDQVASVSKEGTNSKESTEELFFDSSSTKLSLDVRNHEEEGEVSAQNDGFDSDEELELFHTAGDHCASDDSVSTPMDTVSGSVVRTQQGGHRNCSSSLLQMTLKDLFGYDSIRDGQEWAVSRCLAKQKTLLVSPTGYGKSMCYILPAALMSGICIVVSPLLSLIQVRPTVVPSLFRLRKFPDTNFLTRINYASFLLEFQLPHCQDP